MGNQDLSNHTPLLAIPPFPSHLKNLDFFQYINYALFGVTGNDPALAHFPLTLQIGASVIDQYDNDSLTTRIYFNSGPNSNNCDFSLGSACITFGADAGKRGPEASVIVRNSVLFSVHFIRCFP